jgi:hypothetical protein
MNNSRPVFPVTLVIPVPILHTIRMNNSRPVFPVIMAIPVPNLPAIWINSSRSVIPVQMARRVTKPVSPSLERSTGFKD